MTGTKSFAYLGEMDLILAEGFKSSDFPKIEVFRKNGPYQKPLLDELQGLTAVATDAQIDTGGLPRLDLNDIHSISNFIQARFLGREETCTG